MTETHAHRNGSLARDQTRVLLVEDNDDLCFAISTMLRMYWPGDLDVLTASDAGEAEARLHEGGVSAVLMDLGLPDADGLETLEQFAFSYPHVPVVVLSGRADHVTPVEARQRGARDYVIKGDPDARELCAILQRAITTPPGFER